MADDGYDPGANSVVVAGPAANTATPDNYDPSGSTQAAPAPPPSPILNSSFRKLPTTADPNESLWSKAGTFLRSVDEGAGFDTTAAYGTPAPPRADNPWGTVIGQGMSKVAGTVGGLARGMSFGLAPRLDRATEAGTSALDRLFGGKGQAPGSELAQEKFAADNPGLNTAAEVAGAAPTAAIGEAALTRLIPPVQGSSIVSRALDTLSQATRGAVVGGSAGGGLNEKDPVSGALYGAGAGAAIPLGLGGAALIGRPVADAMLARLSSSAANQQAASKIAQAFGRDSISGAEAQDALRRLGPLGGLIDAGGANVQGLGEAMAGMPGANRQLATQFLEGRMEGAPSRINAAINVASGTPAEFNGTMAALDNQRATAAAPKYEAAFSRIVPTPEEAASVQRFVTDPIGQDALQEGMRLIQLRKMTNNEVFDPADYGVIQNADGKYELGPGTPNLRLFDAVKRGYDTIVQNIKDGSPTGKLTTYGKEVDNARRTYVGQLRDMYPRYGAALDAWGGPSQSMNALSMGRDILSEDPEVTAATIGQLSPNDKDFFRAGVARAVKDKAAATQDGADQTRRIFGNQLIRDKIAAGFDNPAAFNQFADTMQNEATFAKTRNEVLKGSQTARRLAGQQDINLGAPAMLAASGHPLPAAISLLQQQARANPGMDTDPVKRAIAQQLFNQQPDPYFSALQAAQNRQATPFVRVPAGIAGSVMAAQPPTPQQQRGRGLLNQ